MENRDDELREFEERGAAPLPLPNLQGVVDHDGARIWYASYGSGRPVVLLHGGLGNSEHWGNQVAALTESAHCAIVIDSRGHGRSSRDGRPFSYELMASDVLAVLDTLRVEEAAVVGWSDGAIIGLILGMNRPERITRVFAFGGNMDLGGNKAIDPEDPLIARMYHRAVKDYARLSPTPTDFNAFSAAVRQMMQSQPNYTARDLAEIRVPVAIVDGARDEFIERRHVEYLADSVPDATLVILPDVSHFAPLQRPKEFNRAMLAFLDADAEPGRPRF